MISLSIIGNLGKDAEVKEVNGKKVINFSVCHTEKRKDGTSKSTWVECGKWGETTAVAPYLLKGTKVYVEGIPDLNLYKKNDGEPGGSIRLMVNKIELLGNTEKVHPAAGAPPLETPVDLPEDDPLQQLPF